MASSKDLNGIITFPNDPATTKSVSVAGAFSNWEPISMNFNEATDQWEFDLYGYLTSLKSKKKIIDKTSYMYKFILNEINWCCNILKPIVKDESGNDNNIVEIDIANFEESSSIKTPTPESTGNPVSEFGSSSPLSSIHSIDDDADDAKISPNDEDGEGDTDINFKQIDDDSIADQVSGFFGFLQWLWDLILLRIFGTGLQKTHSDEIEHK